MRLRGLIWGCTCLLRSVFVAWLVSTTTRSHPRISTLSWNVCATRCRCSRRARTAMSWHWRTGCSMCALRSCVISHPRLFSRRRRSSPSLQTLPRARRLTGGTLTSGSGSLRTMIPKSSSCSGRTLRPCSALITRSVRLCSCTPLPDQMVRVPLLS